jgi:hypothetical protein
MTAQQPADAPHVGMVLLPGAIGDEAMTADLDLGFRPDTYWSGDQEINYPILADAPMFGGGSYLPRLKPDEFEIAGVALRSTLGDVISVRARPTPTGRISFRVVDEYGNRYKLQHPLRHEPLSLGELIELMDTADFGGGVGLVEPP